MWPCALRALLRALVALGTLAAAQGQLRHLPPGHAVAKSSQINADVQQACEAVDDARLLAWCGGELLTPDCFRIESVPAKLPESCRLQGPRFSDQASSLFGEGRTLEGGDMVLAGHLRFTSLRLELTGSLTLEDAQVVMSGNETTKAPKSGGAFSAKGVVNLTESNLTVLGTKAQDNGGGFSAGDLILFQSTLSIVDAVALAGSGGAFAASGGVTMEQSSMRLQHTRAALYGGGINAYRTVRLQDASIYILDSVADRGGGIFCGALELTASLMTIRGAKADGHGGALWLTSIYKPNSHVSITDSRVYIEDCATRGIGGGFITRNTDGVRISGSVVKVSNVQAGLRSGGFDAGSLQVSASVLQLENTRATSGTVGAFHVWRRMVIGNHSNVTVSRTSAIENVGGFFAEAGLEVVDGSMLSIHEATAKGACGGFQTLAFLRIAGASTVRVSQSTSQAGDGGGFCTNSDVLLTGRSQLLISDATSGRDRGGCLRTHGSLHVMDQSVVRLQRCSAAASGGGAKIAREVLVAGGSQFWVSDATAGDSGGGFSSLSVQVFHGSLLHLQNVSAATGGGFYTYQRVEVAGGSNLKVWGSDAKLRHGGAFVVERLLHVTNHSQLEVENATAQASGAAFWAETVSVRTSSKIVILNGTAGTSGGCFVSDINMELSDSLMIASECSARVDGGGIYAKSVSLRRSRLSISGSALERGGGIFAKRKFEAWDSELQVLGLDRAAAGPAAALVLGSGAFVAGPLRLSNSALHLQNLQGESAVASRCLLLSKSTVSLDAATKVGIFVGNEACTCGAAAGAASSRAVGSVGSTSFLMDGAVVGSGVSSTLLSLEPCGNETLEIAHLHLKTPARASVAKTTASSRLRNVTVEYSQPLDAIQLLAAPSFEAESVHVSCAACAHGVTFASPSVGSGLQVVSPASLLCENAAAVLNGTTPRCRCAFSQQVPDKNTYGRDVRVSETGDYCMYCQAHSRARGEGCEKCPPHQAWSEGTGDPCAFLPAEAELWLPLLLGAAVFVFLAAAAFEVIWAPLAVVDAHTLGCEGVIVTVQGPICRLPKFLVHHIHRNVSFRFQRTGLSWLDGPQRIAGKVKRLSRCKLQLPPQPEQPPYDCATSKGFLGVSSGYGPMLLQLWILLFSLLLVPTSLAVAMLSRNDARHVLVTAVLFFVLPLMVCAAALHPVVAWLLQRHRTPLQEACREYLSGLSTGSATILPEDPDHPKNQGLSIQALQHFWEHFKHFLLERNMHFVVANIVKPLTEKRQTSFVSLLQGKSVSYFVSHSWATPFQHFVQCLQRHAAFTGALEPTYWICSFANNQWDIAKEIGTDVLDSAFAKVLHSDVQGVVMVLDQQVQPFTRVWCLFELFLSCEKALEVVFATDSGILGDECCDSVGVALELGRRISGLQVETCHASSEIDKQRIFAHIRSELGSLARMDHKIKDMIRDMLRRNLQHARTSTADLRQQLEQ